MPKYKVLGNLEHSGKAYKIGDEIDIPASIAELHGDRIESASAPNPAAKSDAKGKS